jgi:hypothetical protein
MRGFEVAERRVAGVTLGTGGCEVKPIAAKLSMNFVYFQISLKDLGAVG